MLPHPCVYSNRLGTGSAGAGRSSGLSDPGFPLQDGLHRLRGHSPHGESCVSSWRGDPGEESGTRGPQRQPRDELTETRRDKRPSPRTDAELDEELEPAPLEGNGLYPARLAGAEHTLLSRAASGTGRAKVAALRAQQKRKRKRRLQRTSLLDSRQPPGPVCKCLLLLRASVSPEAVSELSPRRRTRLTG